MKYYFIAGERSGDLHASNLIKSLKKEDTRADIRAVGGKLMQEEGAVIFKDYSQISFMGFLEVFLHLFRILRVMSQVKTDILIFKPEVMVLVDFAGFNMKIAAFAKQHGIKVFYYISPKVWAWNQKRALKIKRLVNRMFVILPFEKEFYKSYDYDVDYVGNPVNDAVANFKADQNFRNKVGWTSKPIIALLPGSRRQEVENMLAMLETLPDQFPQYEFVIAGVSNLPYELYRNLSSNDSVSIIYDQTYDLLTLAEAAIVTSGTATLETALMNVPQVVVYKTSALSYAIAKLLIKVKYISLVNLIAGEEVVKELIQKDFSSKSCAEELTKILPGGTDRNKVLQGYKKVKQVLGNKPASQKAAALMHAYLKNS